FAEGQAEARLGTCEAAGRIRLAVTRLGGVAAGCGRLARDPAHVVGLESRRLQPGMVVALHHPQGVLRDVLARDEPGRVFAAPALAAFFLHPADAQPLALAEGIEGQALVLADGAPARVLDRTRLLADVAVEELAEGPLADEADARG